MAVDQRLRPNGHYSQFIPEKIAISFGKLGLKLDVVVRWPLFRGAREPRFDCTTIVCFLIFNFFND
jgi:hypothetical protein